MFRLAQRRFPFDSICILTACFDRHLRHAILRLPAGITGRLGAEARKKRGVGGSIQSAQIVVNLPRNVTSKLRRAR